MAIASVLLTATLSNSYACFWSSCHVPPLACEPTLLRAVVFVVEVLTTVTLAASSWCLPLPNFWKTRFILVGREAFFWLSRVASVVVSASVCRCEYNFLRSRGNWRIRLTHHMWLLSHGIRVSAIYRHPDYHTVLKVSLLPDLSPFSFLKQRGDEAVEEAYTGDTDTADDVGPDWVGPPLRVARGQLLGSLLEVGGCADEVLGHCCQRRWGSSW